MSDCISAIIYYDGEVCDTKNGVIFLSENIAQMAFNQSIDFAEFRKRIRRKIFGTTPSRVSFIKYRFYASIDPVTYDSFDIKGVPNFEAMVQTHLASGSPYLELYVQFYRQMIHLQLQHWLLVEKNTRPLPDTPLVGGKTRKYPCLVAVWNT